jgi:hypothetical protein
MRARRHHLPDAQPVPFGDPHGVLDSRGRETLEDGLLAEGPIEPDFEGDGPQRLAGTGDDLFETRDGIHRVVDVAGPIPHPEHLPGLRQVARDERQLLLPEEIIDAGQPVSG